MATGTQRITTYATIAALLIAPAEGLWLTAKVDRIGTGQPPTGCYGMTSADRPVHVGDKYTKPQCRGYLIQDIPKYWNPVAKCINPKAKLTEHFKAALTSASYNAGPSAVCKSPMVARINSGSSIEYACAGLHGWHVNARGVFVQGLVNRRAKEYQVCITKD